MGALELGRAGQRCARCAITYAIAEPSSNYVNRYSCPECGVPFWEQKGCGNVSLGIEPRNAERIPTTPKRSITGTGQ